MSIFGMSMGEALMWCAAVALVLASASAYYTKGIVGKIVVRLIKTKAFDKETARSLDEIGCDSFLCRFALRNGYLQDGGVMSHQDRYFITEGKKDKMISKYGKTENGASLAVSLLIIGLATAVAAVFFPDIERLVGSWL